ncbi:ankyrin repeat-containing domain protein [Tuber brumale]|nr:ankyrin repeat-containing domain protein [Tuber brumale]
MSERSTTTTLLSLPNELLLEITNYQLLSDQNSFLQTNRHLAWLFSGILIDTLFHTRDKIRGRRAIYAFASQNDIAGVQRLIDRGILEFIGSPSSIIITAIASQKATTLRILLDCGLNADIPDDHGWRPILFAILHRRIEMVQLLLSKPEYGINPNRHLDESESLLIVAIKAGYPDIVKILLEHPDMDVNATEPLGRSGLQISIYHKMIDIVKLLLAHPKTNINITNSRTLTPLNYAIQSESEDIVLLLLQHPRLNIYAPIRQGNTPLHEAARLKNSTILKILLHDERMNIIMNALNANEYTPLHVACGSSEEAVKVLLDDGRSDVNARGNQFIETPLHIAALYGSDATCNMLQEDARVDISLRNIWGRTALSIIKNRQGECIETIQL